MTYLVHDVNSVCLTAMRQLVEGKKNRPPLAVAVVSLSLCARSYNMLAFICKAANINCHRACYRFTYCVFKEAIRKQIKDIGVLDNRELRRNY